MDKSTAITLFMNTILGTKSQEFFNLLKSISSVVEVPKKRILFNEGDSEKYFYFLLSGKIKLYKISKSGKEVIVKIISSGEIFAEVSILEMNYPVTAITLENSILLKIDGSSFWKFFEKDRDLNKRFMFLLLQRIKNLLSRLEFVGTESVEKRLYHYLLEISKVKGESFLLPISKGELANLLFTSPETLSRTFSSLSKKGLIELNGKKVKIKKLT